MLIGISACICTQYWLPALRPWRRRVCGSNKFLNSNAFEQKWKKQLGIAFILKMYALRLQINKRERVKINNWGLTLIQNLSNSLRYNLKEQRNCQFEENIWKPSLSCWFSSLSLNRFLCSFFPTESTFEQSQVIKYRRHLPIMSLMEF